MDQPLVAVAQRGGGGEHGAHVVHTGDVVLVASLERSQDVKLLRERLEVLGLDHLL